MKRILGLFLFFVMASADAALINVGGGLIYDDDLNISWLQDANFALTSGFDADGLMTWDEATAWADGLVYAGFSNWRLPDTIQPDASCGSQTDPGGGFPLQGSGTGCTGSEMGHLANVEGISTSTTLFTNLQSEIYWSATVYAPDTDDAWSYQFPGADMQGTTPKTDLHFAWAVRTGFVDFVAPLPGAVWLFGSALGLLGWIKHRRPT